MSEVFIKFLNMSITASWLILAVILVRVLLKKAPKWIRCLLWGLVAVRLLFPFSIESVFSLIPSSETIPSNIAFENEPHISSGISALNSAVNPVLSESFAPVPKASVNPMQVILQVAAAVWIAGILCMLIYAFVSYRKLKKTVSVCVPVKEGIFACDEVKAPFILGIFRPVIYVPSSLQGETLACVIRHENAHLQRRDHWWKPLGFLLLAVYWFNPLCWVAYILLCRDIEMACDEKVIRDMDKADMAAYSQALLDCSFPRKSIAACPLAFGEVSVKERVKGVLNYKKPGFWIVIAAFAVCAVVAVCFATSPVKKEAAPSVRVLKVKMEDLKDLVTSIRENGYGASLWFADGMEKTQVGYMFQFQVEEYLANVEWEASGPAKCLTDEEHLLLTNEKFSLAVYKDLQLARLQMNGQTKLYQIGAKDYETLRELFHPNSEEEAAAARLDDVELYAPYVGDASKVSRIAGSLNYPDGYTYNSIKIWSKTEPYGLDVYLNGAFVSDGEVLPEAVTNALHTCAEAAFASIGNLGSVRFYAVDEYGQKWFLYKQDRQGEKVLEGSFVFGEQRGSVLTLEKEGAVDRFSFSYDMLSSYWPHGTVTRKGDRLVCRTDDGEFQYTFTIKDENTLLFDAKNSSTIAYTDLQVSTDLPVEDGSMYLRLSIPQGTFASKQEPQYSFQLFEDGRFLYSHKLLDSFGVNGTAFRSGDRLVCRDDRGEYEFIFNIMDENTLVLDGKNSTLTASSAGQMPLMDRDTFLRIS